MLQQLVDAFIVMLGDLGTLEEAIETWNAIKIGERFSLTKSEELIV